MPKSYDEIQREIQDYIEQYRESGYMHAGIDHMISAVWAAIKGIDDKRDPEVRRVIKELSHIWLSKDTRKHLETTTTPDGNIGGRENRC